MYSHMALTALKSQSLRKALFIATAIAAAIVVAQALFAAGMEPARANTILSAVSKPHAPELPDLAPLGDELPARGKFLVAGRNLTDPRFQETVVLLIDYSAEGATGIIINRPTKVSLSEVLPSMPGLKERADVVFYGGPVESHRMLMLIRSGEKLEESSRVFGNVYVSASRNTLERMLGSHKTEKQLRVYAGYAGWMPRQLDWELSRGDWLIVSADAGSIFEKKPSEVWRELFRRGSAIQVWNRGVSILASGMQ
jgi:putative transcriptional regulator